MKHVNHEKGTLSWLWVLFALSLLLPGCSQNRPPSFSREAGWMTSNCHQSFWSRQGLAVPETAFRQFQIYVDDPDGPQDIVEIRVTDPTGGYWRLEDHYNATGGFWNGGWYYYSSSSPHAVTLGVYTVLVRDSAGHEITDTIAFTGPGSLAGSGFTYSEDYTGSTSGGEPMVRRASVESAVKTATDLTIAFTVTDDRVINGFVGFHDAGAFYITQSEWFRDTVNAGTGLNVDGTANTLQIASGDLDLGTSSFAEIAGFHMVLTDGAQYAPEVTRYNHRSLSAYVEF